MTAAKNDPGPTNTDKKTDAPAKADPAPTPNTDVKPTGSPVTAGTKDNNNGRGGTQATIGNDSSSKVAETKDNSPATGPGNHANIAGATQDPKNPDVVVPGAVLTEDSRTGRAPDQAAELPNAGSPKVGSESGTEAEDEFEKALNEPDVVPTPSDADLDKRDIEDMGTTLDKMHKKHEAEFGPVRDALREVAVLALDTVGPDTKDSYVVWGYGGKQINLGQLRTISRYFRENETE